MAVPPGLPDGGGMKALRARSWLLVTVAAAAAGVAVAGTLDVVWLRPPTKGAIASGLRFADSLDRSRPTAQVAGNEALASLYLERARLGVGSPFRLIDNALHDPLIPMGLRKQVSIAILGRTAEGLVYSSPPEALDLLSSGGVGLGLAHRNFIEQVLDEADDVRAAELALRLAYQVSAASGVTSPRAAAVAVAAIAQARDRTLARRDAQELLVAARRRDLDPLDLVPVWRAMRRFSVERPLVDPATASQERAASGMLPRLLAGLDSLRDPVPATRRERSLGAATALAAAELAARRMFPPQAPVIVTMGGFGGYVVGGARTAAARAARSTFVQRARGEESLVAEYARLRAVDEYPAEAALSVMTAAVAMRPYAQERPWFPGDPGPSPVEIQNKLGLASMDFDPGVPDTWRTYYARMFDDVVADLTRVFPRLDVSGLRVRFGQSRMRERALALHDPLTRTVYFPLETSAGAMAHELAHDLDWQAARRRYGSRNSYRTDRSMRQFRDGLASTLDRMAGSGAAARRGLRSSPGGDRPTEAFARSVDWLSAAALAREGILNGYLSAVQDEWLTGYASATAPRRDGPQGDATMLAVREIAEVAPNVVSWFEASYGEERRPGLADAVRRSLVAPLPRLDSRHSASVGFDGWSTATRILRMSPAASGGWSCLLRTPALQGNDREVLRRTMETAAGARIGGLLRRWGDYSERTSGSWRFRSLGGGPWRPAIADSIERELRDALLWRAARVDDGRLGSSLVERAEREASWNECARGGGGR